MSNNILLVDGTAKSFKSSGGDVVWTPQNTATAHGRISAVLDLSTPRYLNYRWVLTTKFSTATVGNAIRLYVVELSTNATTYQDGGGGLALSDADLSAETLLQYAAKQIGPTGVHSAAGANTWSGKVNIITRYIQIALWNSTGVSLTNTAGDHEFRLEPINPQVQ